MNAGHLEEAEAMAGEFPRALRSDQAGGYVTARRQIAMRLGVTGRAPARGGPRCATPSPSTPRASCAAPRR